jgi:hypothetical protein
MFVFYLMLRHVLALTVDHLQGDPSKWPTANTEYVGALNYNKSFAQ